MDESEFVEQNHNLVQKFLNCYRLDEREYYDVVIFSFLKAARDYLGNEDLRKKYSFDAIAFRRMRFAYFAQLRYQMRTVRYPAPLSLNAAGSGIPLETGGLQSRPLEYAMVKEELRNIISLITDREMEVVAYRMRGYKTHEIAKKCGIFQKGVHGRLYRLRKRIVLNCMAG